MYIKSDDGGIINTDCISNIRAQKSDKMQKYIIVAVGSTQIIVAGYRLQRTAQSAVEEIWEALYRGEEFFDLPLDGDPRLVYTEGPMTERGDFVSRKGKTTGKTK